MGERLEQLTNWLQHELKLGDFTLAPASADASFRRYFRVSQSQGSLIVMDAPPDKEDCRPWIHLAQQFRSFGLNVPEVLASDLTKGFLLISDLGSQSYLSQLQDATVDRLYGDALGALATLQACGSTETLPPYDRRLLKQELSLFVDWYVGRHLDIPLATEESALINGVFEQLIASALEQPVVCVHRDYHSRNLMVTSVNNPGIIDFQDAVAGPITYDLVSLLRDCYIAWPQEQVQDWALGYHDLALQSGILPEEDEIGFLRWFDWMGVQRHLKAIGIFARLYHRDGKAGYLGDIPRTLNYVLAVSQAYPELQPFHAWLQRVVVPALEKKV